MVSLLDGFTQYNKLDHAEVDLFYTFAFGSNAKNNLKQEMHFKLVIIRMSPSAPDNRHRAVQPKAKERYTVSAGEEPSCHPHRQQRGRQVATGKSSPGQKDDWGVCE